MRDLCRLIGWIVVDLMRSRAGRSAALMDYFERPKLAVDIRRNTDVS